MLARAAGPAIDSSPPRYASIVAVKSHSCKITIVDTRTRIAKRIGARWLRANGERIFTRHLPEVPRHKCVHSESQAGRAATVVAAARPAVARCAGRRNLHGTDKRSV